MINRKSRRFSQLCACWAN